MNLVSCNSKRLLSPRGVCHVNLYCMAKHNFFKTKRFADLVNLGSSRLHNLSWTEIFKIEGLIVSYSLFALRASSRANGSLGVELSRKEQKKRRRSSVD